MTGIKLPKLCPRTWTNDLLDDSFCTERDRGIILCGGWAVDASQKFFKSIQRMNDCQHSKLQPYDKFERPLPTFDSFSLRASGLYRSLIM